MRIGWIVALATLALLLVLWLRSEDGADVAPLVATAEALRKGAVQSTFHQRLIALYQLEPQYFSLISSCMRSRSALSFERDA